jgi:hypothetical protein
LQQSYFDKEQSGSIKPIHLGVVEHHANEGANNGHSIDAPERSAMRCFI